MNLRIRVLHSIDYPEIGQECNNKHINILQRFNLDKEIDSSKSNWWENPCSYLVIIEDLETGEIGASVRLDIIDESNPLPLAKAIEPFLPNITNQLHEFNNVLGEMCGLWVHENFSKRNLVPHLVNSVLAISSKVCVKHIIGIAPTHTKNFFCTKGFKVKADIGNKGEFFYPNKNYISTVIEMSDTLGLSSLENEDRDHIKWLRSNPVSTVQEAFDGKVTTLQYDLRIM